MINLWSNNHPRNFWLLQSNPSEDIWQEAIRMAIPVLESPVESDDVETTLKLTLGEGQFGSNHFRLSLSRQLYYQIKPLLPQSVIGFLKSANARTAQNESILHWPIEDRYVRFQWEIVRNLLIQTGEKQLVFRYFWPVGKRFALVLTHDIETAEGQAFVRKVADLEEELGFHSSFNFVPERYNLDHELINELEERGFEIGTHGLRHDGKLYNSEKNFRQRSQAINSYLENLNAVGFRSPLMQRNPEWMQALKIEYDLSFFDTDPYEPMPGGCMTIWPFSIGHFIELPYTLVQDSTLSFLLGETTPRLWLDKLEFIEKYHGMALVNTHPDYLKEPKIWDIYLGFLNTLKEQNNYWHALPRDVARWWRKRSETPPGQESSEITLGTLFIENDRMIIN